MIYTFILKPKFRDLLRVLAFTILVAFSVTLYSCQTVYTEDYTPEKLKTDDDVKYLEAKTIKDSTINLEEFNVTYHKNFKDSSNILLLEKTDTTHSFYWGRPAYKLKKSIMELNLNKIKLLKTERTEFGWLKTSIFVVAILATMVIIGIIIVDASWKGPFF